MTSQPLPEPSAPPAAGEIEAQVVRTVPERIYRRLSHGDFGILESYLRAFRSTSRTAVRRPSGAGKPAKVAKPARCRSCGAELTTAAPRKTGRCDDCPPTYDEATFEALRTWRVTVCDARPRCRHTWSSPTPR